MSSLRNASKSNQKVHRERHQPTSRSNLGLLEKKKDYKNRSSNYNKNAKMLKVLQKRALNKNPDEFYFHMINSKVMNGEHVGTSKTRHRMPQQLELLQSQNWNYISFKRIIEGKKIDKLQSGLHMIDEANEMPNDHIFFVNGKTDTRCFDLATRLDTCPSLLNRKTNRPRLSHLTNVKVPAFDKNQLKKLKNSKHKSYHELFKRIDREKQLGLVQYKLELKHILERSQSNKPVLMHHGNQQNNPVHRWKFERKQ